MNENITSYCRGRKTVVEKVWEVGAKVVIEDWTAATSGPRQKRIVALKGLFKDYDAADVRSGLFPEK